MTGFRGSVRVAAILLCLAAVPGAAAAGGEQRVAKEILAATGVRGGLVVHVGCGDGRLTAALRATDGFLVHGLDTDEGRVSRAREAIRELGLYGPVSADRFDGRGLPYVDNAVNLVVSEDLGRVPTAEVMRVLCPGGVAYVRVGGAPARRSLGEGGWKKTVKPRPDEIDEWTHWLHDASGNAVARDTVVGPPRHAQWIAEPRWQRHHELTPSVSALVSAGGRLFGIVNEAPPGIDGPDRWVLLARDAFNGKLLWKRPIAEWGWRQWGDHSYGHGRWNHPTHIARRLVAVGPSAGSGRSGRVYVTLGFNAPLTALDAATGRTIRTYAGTEFTDEVLYDDGTLILAVNEGAQGPGRVKVAPPVKKAVLAVNAETGEVLWRTGDLEGAISKADAIERVTHLMLTAGGGKVFCVEDGAVVALDRETGKRAWRRDRGERPRPVTYGNYYFTNLTTLVYHDGTVLLIEPDPKTRRAPWDAPTKAELYGIDAETGKERWRRPCGIWGHYNPGDLFVVDGTAWVHAGEGFSMTGLDPRTGEVKRTIETKRVLDEGHHHRCHRNKATTRFAFTARRGVELIEFETGRSLRHHWVRGTCRYGTLPCNGLLYAPPHPCICYVTAKLTGFWALAARRQSRRPAPSARLVRGPAFSSANPQSAIGNPQSNGWPTYRRDAARSGCAGANVAPALQPAWTASVGGRLTAPVVAEGKVLVASSDSHTVWALGASDGKVLWRYVAGGRVDAPPTVYRGLALFGSADGWVYCLRLADGALAWRRRAAREELRLLCRGRLESPWPVYGGVLVQDGVAYFAAGRSSFLDGGITVFAVEPETGKLLRERRIDSVDPDTGDMPTARLRYDMPPDALGALPDVFVADGESVFLRHLRFDPADLTCRSAAEPAGKKDKRTHPAVGKHLMSVTGLLDESWFNQNYWTIDGKAHCKLLVFDESTAYGVKPYPGSARHSRAIFRPGGKGYALIATQRPKHTKRWSVEVPVRIRSMVIAGPTLFAAGSPDTVDPRDPWGAIQGRKGGVLWAISTADGKKLAAYPLAHPPVFNGMAAAHGRLFVSTTGGQVACMGKESDG